MVSGEKPVMVSHSYGALVSAAFFKWVDKLDPQWVENHVDAYVNIAGPLLGLPKSISALLSGMYVGCGRLQLHVRILRTCSGQVEIGAT